MCVFGVCVCVCLCVCVYNRLRVLLVLDDERVGVKGLCVPAGERTALLCQQESEQLLVCLGVPETERTDSRRQRVLEAVLLSGSPRHSV